MAAACVSNLSAQIGVVPTLADAREVLFQRIAAQSDGQIRLLNFKSESGAKPAPWDTDGERRFLITYQAEIEFGEPCVWDTQFEQQGVTFKTLKPGAVEAVRNRIFGISARGERYLIQGQIALKGTGNGWEATGFTWSDPPQRIQVAEPPLRYPSDVLENSLLKVRFYVPDGKQGYYRGTRFDWSGLISLVEYAGHSFFSEFKQEHDPLNHDDTCGTSEEFGINSPAGYAEARVGETFLKVGIGLLMKPQEDGYGFFKRYPIAQEGLWVVTKRHNQVEFRQDFHSTNGWAYTYIKTLEVHSREPALTIHRVLKNTGTRTIDTDHYCHNFLKIDEVPAGPAYRIDFPFTPRFGEGSRPNACVGITGSSLVFLRAVPEGQSVWVRIEGFTSAADNRMEIRNRETNASMEIKTDQPATRMAFFSQGGVLSPEPFVQVKVPPGETKQWQTTYTFHQSNRHSGD